MADAKAQVSPPPSISPSRRVCIDFAVDDILQSVGIYSSSRNGQDTFDGKLRFLSAPQSSITFQPVTYAFMGSLGLNQMQKVERCIGEWTQYANLEFQRIDRIDPESLPMIQISSYPDQGNWSYIGISENGSLKEEPTMNLAWVDDDPGMKLYEYGTILHELGHAMGMVHEHSQSIGLDVKVMEEIYRSASELPREIAAETVARFYKETSLTNFYSVDASSVMAMFMPEGMAIGYDDIYPNYRLSDKDKAWMLFHYPFLGQKSLPPGWDWQRMLEASGFPDDASPPEDINGYREYYSEMTCELMQEAIKRDKMGMGVSELARSSCLTDVREYEPRSEDHKTPSGVARAVFKKSKKLWRCGDTIYFTFLDGNKHQRDKVRTVCVEWSEHANVKFCEISRKKVTSEMVDAKGKSMVVVRISFAENLGSWSLVGKKDIMDEEAGKATMNLGYITKEKGITSDERGDILHEFGHTLGLIHEHQSPTRNDFFGSLVEKEVRKDYKGAASFVDNQILKKFEVKDVSNFSVFDPKSVMLYEFRQGESTNRVSIERNSKLSKMDETFMVINYPGKGGVGKLEEALETVKVDDETKAKILELYRARKLSGVRDAFTEWTAKNITIEDTSEGVIRTPKEPETVTPGRPQRDIGRGGDEDEKKFQAGAFLPILVESFKKFFNPGGNQTFVLQFPGRFLQTSEYAWDTGSAGVYGQFIKPVAANESEFRLTDQLYDDAEVVSGPNGISLSLVYEQLLHNLLPIFKDTGLGAQQQEIRKWLLEEDKATPWVKKLIESQHKQRGAVLDDDQGDGDDDNDDNDAGQASRAAFNASSSSGRKPQFAVSNKLDSGGTDKINRMELSDTLLQEYLQAKQVWERERDAMIDEALKLKSGTAESAAALNSLTRKLAHITATREAQLASKYADAVVRGYTHNVREYVSYLDVKSAAEMLQDAKDGLREASMSSLSGSMKVYPVQMTPIDWFQGLSTSFKLEDLTQDPDLILQQIKAKSQQVEVLNSHLTALRLGAKGDAAGLRASVEEAQKEMDTAQAALANKYTTNFMSMVKACYDNYGLFDGEKAEKMKNDGDLVQPAGSGPGWFEELKTSLGATSAAQVKLSGATRAYSQGLAAQALAEATDTQQQQEQVKLQVKALTSDINELTARYTSLNKREGTGTKATSLGTKDVKDVKHVPEFPASNQTAGGSRWQEIVMYHKVKNEFSQSHTSSSSSVSNFSANLWIASGSSSNSSSIGIAQQKNSSTEYNVTLGFRATLVTVDRAGWFQPQFFKQSGSFYHIDPEVYWSGEKGRRKSHPLLPAFPVGYVLCKDITIKIEYGKAEAESTKQQMQSDASASGGILCFSYSQGSSSSSSDNSYSFQSLSNGCVIRIPGPQILGYIMERTDLDTTQDMPSKLPKGFFIPRGDKKDDRKPGMGVHQDDNPDDTTTPFFKALNEAMTKSNLSADKVSAIQATVRKELKTLSEAVGADISQGGRAADV